MKRPPVGTELRPLIVSATVDWSLAGHWFVNLETMNRDEAGARGINERRAHAYIACRSEAQARRIAVLLSTAACHDGPEPANEDE